MALTAAMLGVISYSRICKMNFNKLLILLLIIIFGCNKPEKSDSFKGDSFVLGQWQTTNKNWPHWIMFDSSNNYYRWSFNEQVPEMADAKYVVADSIITFTYTPLEFSPDFGIEEITDSLKFKHTDQNSLTILPLDSGIMPTYIYKRAEFKGPRYADVYIFFLTKTEADSLENDKNIEPREPNYKNLEKTFYVLEHSFINRHLIDSSVIVTRDGTTYNKFELGGYGVIYFTNDSTYIRRGIPNQAEFEKEIDAFFPFVNRVPLSEK